MTKHFTSFERSAVDIAKYFEQKQHELATRAYERDGRGWRDLLDQIIQREVLPRLQKAPREPTSESEALTQSGIEAAVIAAFVDLLIADDVEQLRTVADRVILYTGGRDALLHELLAPAARLLGQMWEEDSCDFTTVTIGVYRLTQIMKETEVVTTEVSPSHDSDRRILLLPAPGEQHSFGINLVADAFRGDGWCVRSAPAVSRSQLLRLVKDEWFDVIGLSVSTERFLKGLPVCIRAVRAASCNKRAFVMLGGYAVTSHPERARFLGANSLAEDAVKAVQLANKYVETTVTDGFCQFITEPIDAGRAL
jgi:methanogenic corrinoid protein MtbC1